MESKNIRVLMIAFVIILAVSGTVLCQDSVALSVAPSALRALEAGETAAIAEGQKLKIEGLVISQNDASFTVRDAKGTETVVVVNEKTEIKKERKGWFNRDRSVSATEIRRGLRLKVEGRGNGEGQLVAKNITFDEQDLKTAEALESRVDPVETLAKSTQELAENNQTRVSEAERRLDQAEQSARQLSGQVEELSSVANTALSEAKTAQSTADGAVADAKTANDRIGALDDYEIYRSITVRFKPGSARLSAEAKAEIDAMAQSLGADLTGWIVAVEGFADSTGRTATNKSLSERRANAVIDYLVTKNGLPPRRVVQPFGYGELNPAAANNTREGRALNRRAEITILVNKGISPTQRTASKEQ